MDVLLLMSTLTLRFPSLVHEAGLFGNFLLGRVVGWGLCHFSFLDILCLILWVVENIKVIWTKQHSTNTENQILRYLIVEGGWCVC